MQIEGSTFIVTGGASGLGAATARMIVDGGGRVVIADLVVDALQSLKLGFPKLSPDEEAALAAARQRLEGT